MRRIGIVGGGAAGLYAAYRLAERHDVVLIEARPQIGGHVDTHRVDVDDNREPVSVDTGFIVFNRRHYPLFSSWIDELGVASQSADMSFGVACCVRGLEYNATSVNRLFCQRLNLMRPSFLGMVRDIVRFYRMAPGLLSRLDQATTLGQWLEGSFGLESAFARDHLVPMAAALWSSPDRRILEFPVVYLLRFMDNHDMLRLTDRPQWQTITGGSQRYVEAALRRFKGRVITNCPVERVVRNCRGGVTIFSRKGPIEVDHVVLACHADQALELLDAPSPAERAVLGAFSYQDNDTVLHTDSSRMPANRLAWAAWNVRRDREEPEKAAITYHMNALQRLGSSRDLFVSLNQSARIDPERILVRRAYRHPIYTPASVAAQQRIGEISGRDRIDYCGAAWGWGFHEDAVRSAARVVDSILRGKFEAGTSALDVLASTGETSARRLPTPLDEAGGRGGLPERAASLSE
ncbi:MAG: NAD(P)/FAD-dependent oxidoreductase [Wenzhouxiangellaceae bacterium]